MAIEQVQLSLGEYIRRLRRQTGRSLDALSKETGVSYTHLSRIESDSALPNADTVTKIAVALQGDLKLMLEMANCLPRAILDRIASHDLTPTALPRSAYQDDGLEASHPNRGPLFEYALAKGLSQEEAAEMASTINTLCALDRDKRRHIVQFLRGLFHEGDDATG